MGKASSTGGWKPIGIRPKRPAAHTCATRRNSATGSRRRRAGAGRRAEGGFPGPKRGPGGAPRPFLFFFFQNPLLVSYACPGRHRPLIFRALKGLATLFDVSVRSPGHCWRKGWEFRTDFLGATGGPALRQTLFCRDIYTRR